MKKSSKLDVYKLESEMKLRQTNSTYEAPMTEVDTKTVTGVTIKITTRD